MTVRSCADGWIDRNAVRAVNLFDFDAVGNGVTPDTTALRNAVLAAASTNLPLRIPVGTFLIDGAITASSPITVFGDDIYASIIKQSSASSPGFSLVTSNFSMRNLTLRGANSSNSASLGINGGNSKNCFISGCIIEQWGGVAVGFGASSTGCEVVGNIVRNNLSEGIYFGPGSIDNIIMNNLVYGNTKNGIDVNGVRTVVHGNVCRNNGVSPDTTDTCGILVGTSSGSTSTDNVITSNICDTNVQNGIFIWGAGTVRRFNVSNNICINTTNGWGINLSGGSGASFDRVSVSGNVCNTNAAAGIVANGVDDSVFHGNICAENTSHGLHITATNKTAARNVVTGNSSRSNAGNGLQIDNVSVTDTIINANRFSGNAIDYNLSAGARNFVSIGANGTFTCTAAATSTISDANMVATAKPIITPTNDAAGLLLRSKTCSVGTVSNGSFIFTVSATGAGAPAGTETFAYSY